MAIDTPATLAILGAGPIGLEAALYARFLGYNVAIYESGEVAEHVRAQGHLLLFPSFQELSSPLGLAAISAQDEEYIPPEPDQRLTGKDWRERYLSPLANTDLLVDSLRLRTKVIGVAKGELLKGDMAGNEDRGDWPFRVLSVTESGEERVEEFDAVLDCTGVFAQHNYLGEGGLPALGETKLAATIAYDVPDFTREANDYSDKHVCVVGAGLSSATTIKGLLELVKQFPKSKVTWITRREREQTPSGPVASPTDDPSTAQSSLVANANAAATAGTVIDWRPGSWIQRLESDSDGIRLELSGADTSSITCHRLIANVGHRPNCQLFSELHVTLNPATAGIGDDLATGEPNFYILGAKSRGRMSGFTFLEGLHQIRQLFAILGDRPSLDLYAQTNLPG